MNKKRAARKQNTNEFSQTLSRRYKANYGYMAATLTLSWDSGEIHLGPGEMMALHGVLERALPDLLNNVAHIGDYFYDMLESKVLAHPDHQQQTYRIDGIRYTLLYKEKEDQDYQWEMDIYEEDYLPVVVVSGPDSKICFLQAKEELGFPTDNLKHLDKWHD